MTLRQVAQNVAEICFATIPLICPDFCSFYDAFKLLLHLSTKKQKQFQIDSNPCKAVEIGAKRNIRQSETLNKGVSYSQVGMGSKMTPRAKWLKMSRKATLQLFELLCPDSCSFYTALELLMHLSTKQQKQLQINSNQCKAAGIGAKQIPLTF